jgi:hypothetical protein
MNITIENASQFHDQFRYMGRGDQFTYEALGLLFDYLDGDYELDVIAICCAYSEDSPEYIADQYDVDVRGMDEEQTLDAVLKYLGEKTQVIGVTDAGAVVYNSEF